MKKAGNMLLWAVQQAANIGLAWYGLHGHHMAFNAWIFLCWLFTAIYFFITFVLVSTKVLADSSPNGKRLVESAKKTRAAIGEQHINKYVSFLFDLGLAILLSAFGHYFYAGLVIFQQYLEQTIYDSTLDPRDETSTTS